MTERDAVWDYMTGQMHDSTPALLAAYQRDSAAMPAAAAGVPYGPHPRQVFDLLESPAPWRGTLLYFHAGYWQARDKAMFRIIAPALLAAGIDVALANYPLCPDVAMPALTQAARAAVPGVLAHAAGRGRGGQALITTGHSAGAHIAVELALTEWGDASPIAGVVGLSGVYDLAPLIDTPLNQALRLDPATARAASPIHRVTQGAPPALFVVGGAETPAFQAQTASMAAAWTAAGNRGAMMTVDGADHFSLLQSMAAPGPVLEAVMALQNSNVDHGGVADTPFVDALYPGKRP
jgi:arylformamidase